MAAKDQNAGTLGRAPSGRTPVRPGAASTEAPKPRTPPAQFLREVRAEGRKVTWTSRKETWITTVMVFIMVVLASIFFLIVDYSLGFSMRWLLQTFAA
jgi:preprotein translocase subunit SecE